MTVSSAIYLEFGDLSFYPLSVLRLKTFKPKKQTQQHTTLDLCTTPLHSRLIGRAGKPVHQVLTQVICWNGDVTIAPSQKIY